MNIYYYGIRYYLNVFIAILNCGEVSNNYDFLINHQWRNGEYMQNSNGIINYSNNDDYVDKPYEKSNCVN